MATGESLRSGNWGDSVRWELFPAQELPPLENCTAAFCLAITSDEKIVLMQARRGWGMLGGHREPEDRTIFDTLAREAIEEGGFTPHNPQLFAQRTITSTEPLPRPDGSGMYPFPNSYIVYFWATTESAIVEATGEEVLDTQAFSIDELRGLGEAAIPDLPIIELGWQSYEQQTKR